jgi:Lectin C-type domain
MQNLAIKKACHYFGAALVGVLLAATAHADSAKLMWSGNGHYYQRFDLASVSWASSKYRCESLGAHLVTIPNVSEAAFVEASFLNPADAQGASYNIGGLYVAGKWTWITGETWNYVNWANLYYGQSSGGLKVRSKDGKWGDETYFTVPTSKGYICEWSGNNFLGNAVVKDINGNGVSEFVVLYQDAKTAAHTVLVKDSATQALVSKLTFPAGTKASQGVVALKNIQTNNTTPEIGVMINTVSGITVQIKDIKNNLTLISTIPFLDRSYQARSITSVADINANGADEIVVIGANANGKAKMEMRDSKTKAVLRVVNF